MIIQIIFEKVKTWAALAAFQLDSLVRARLHTDDGHRDNHHADDGDDYVDRDNHDDGHDQE